MFEPYPMDHPRYKRLKALITDPENAYPEPMIDSRYLRRANGTATEEDLESIGRDEATIRAIRFMQPMEPLFKGLEEFEKLQKVRDLMKDWRESTDWLHEGSGPMPDRVLILKIEEVLNDYSN